MAARKSIALCECGCGSAAPIARVTNARYGHIRGEPVRFVRGHHNRVHSAETRAKMSAAKRGKSLSAEHRAKVSASLIGNKRRAGTTQSPETRARMSAARTGRVDSPETRARKSECKLRERNPMYGRRGAEVPGWKGGVTPANAAARLTVEYKEWRISVFQRDDYTCQGCGTRGVLLHAHHIKGFADYPELRTILDNGLTLCEPCHLLTRISDCVVSP